MSPSEIPKLWTTSSKISKFWFPKSFYSVVNWSNLSKTKLWKVFDQEINFWQKMSLNIFIFRILYFLKMCPIYVRSVDNFGRSRVTLFSEKNPLDTYVVSCPSWNKNNLERTLMMRPTAVNEIEGCGYREGTGW